MVILILLKELVGSDFTFKFNKKFFWEFRKVIKIDCACITDLSNKNEEKVALQLVKI